MPPTLAAAGSGRQSALDNERAWTEGRGGALTFPEHWQKPDVRGLLLSRQWRVCAYCGCDLPANDRGDVEHYRPKGRVHGESALTGYWWLAYEPANLLLSCRLCNSTCKGARFPLRPRARRVDWNDRERLHREARLLVDPLNDPLDEWVTVDISNPLVPVIARPELPRTQRNQIEASIELFRLNKDPQRIRQRISTLESCTESLERGDIETVRHMAVRFRPNSMIARAVLEERSPSDVPGPDEEARVLLDLLAQELDISLRVLDEGHEEHWLERLVEELLWCLASLIREAPAALAEGAQRFARDIGRIDDIEARANRLAR